MTETFWTLLHDVAHWEFEIFLMLLFDGLIVGMFAPYVRKHLRHHIERDQRESVQAWSMNPIAAKAGHRAEHPRGLAPQTISLGDCAQCEGERVLLDNSVVICKECGHVTLPPRKHYTMFNRVLHGLAQNASNRVSVKPAVSTNAESE